MLVLSRKVGEEIVIGDNIRVRVLSIQGNQVRLGFIAPRSVAIQREELLAAMAARPVAAALPTSPPAAPPTPDAAVEGSKPAPVGA